MEYIRDKIKPVTKFKNLDIYFKTRVMDGILGVNFFMVYDIDIHQLNLGQFKNLNFLDEIPFKNVFFCICLIMTA
jgi:hypothetical protein